MERAEQLKQCSVCLNKEFDRKQGIICKLTNAQADFEGTCPKFSLDKELELKTEQSKMPEKTTQFISKNDKRFIIIAAIIILIGIIISIFNYKRSIVEGALYFFSTVLLAAIPLYKIENIEQKNVALSFFGILEIFFLVGNFMHTEYEEITINFILILLTISVNVFVYKRRIVASGITQNKNFSSSEKKVLKPNICANCIHRNIKQGLELVCKLTNLPTSFDASCRNYKRDKKIDKKKKKGEGLNIDFFFIVIILILHLTSAINNEKNLYHSEFDLIALENLCWNVLSLFPWIFIRRRKIKLVCLYGIVGLNLVPFFLYLCYVVRWGRSFWDEELTVLAAAFNISLVFYIVFYEKYIKNKKW